MSWIVGILQRAGIVGTAGSTRSAATSAAFFHGKTFNEIANLAGWAHFVRWLKIFRAGKREPAVHEFQYNISKNSRILSFWLEIFPENSP
jgi:hypothetical protein